MKQTLKSVFTMFSIELIKAWILLEVLNMQTATIDNFEIQI